MFWYFIIFTLGVVCNYHLLIFEKGQDGLTSKRQDNN